MEHRQGEQASKPKKGIEDERAETKSCHAQAVSHVHDTSVAISTMADANLISHDDYRWQGDTSPVVVSRFVWLFEITAQRNYSWIPSDSGSIHWRSSPLTVVHAWNTLTGQHRVFHLDSRLIQQIAFLDLQYWSTVASEKAENNSTAHYLEQVREDLLEELGSNGATFLSQPDSTRAWAVRTMHHHGHSPLDRKEYLELCETNGWLPYGHDDPLQYRV